MREIEKKYFLSEDSCLDADASNFAVSPNAWQNGENIRTGSTDAGSIGGVESIGSNLLISVVQPSVVFLELGSATDEENNRMCYFKYNTTGNDHKIVCYDRVAGIEYNVLLSSQVTGGLNFSKYSPIHSAWIVNGYLYWTDSTNNEPRKVNIEAGIKLNHPTYDTDQRAYVSPLNFSEITIIKPPPALSPNALKFLDATFDNNFIANESFEFAFQYVFFDNETTVVGCYSPASRLNRPTDTENQIIVTMDSLEVIPETIRLVNLIVRYSNTNDAQVIKIWDKLVTTEAAEIVAHNAGTTLLTYEFYNNSQGAFIAKGDVLKPFDSVPIYSLTGASAKNRNFLAHNTEGYDTPTTTSLATTLTSINIGGVSLQKNLIEVKVRRNSAAGIPWAYSAYYVFLTEVSPQGYYEITSTAQTQLASIIYPTLPAAPTTVALSGLTYRGLTAPQVVVAVRPVGYGNALQNIFTTTSTIVTVTGTAATTYDVFKSMSQYKIGVVFYDYAMRKCGVVTRDGLVFEIPNRTFNYSTGVYCAVWSLSNANAVNEIPEWAYYYTPVRTLNQLTRFFIDSFTNAAKYATKDANGLYVFTSNTFITGCVGIGLNTTALKQSGLGYVFTEGDVCVLTRDDNTKYELPVIGQDGNYIIIKADDIGTFVNRRFVFEIYTPYKATSQEPFYEVGQMYRILNPGTPQREYQFLSDFFLPDSYVLTRNYQSVTYYAEAMCPNDLFYKRWDNDGGKPNFVTKLGQVVKTQYTSWSDVYIPNTAINGLSTFGALSQINVPEDCGSIQKLVNTSKVQSEGTVMLSICAKETNSMYLGETQITDANGQTQFFGSSQDVIGTINTLKGSFGTTNPESVCEYRGNVYWGDANSEKWIQYSQSGLFPISNYRMTRFWKEWFKKYKSMTAAQVEALGGRPYIYSTVDPAHDELLISLPKLSNTPPKGFLPDYPSTVNYFDILDFTGKVLVYNLTAQPNRWQGAMTFYTEGFATLNNKLYSFKNGLLYEHNQTTSQNNFYGTQYKSRIMVVSNMLPQVPKVYDNLQVQSNIVPTFVYLYATYPYIQASDLVDFDFTKLEGIFYSRILRNKIQPTAIGYDTDRLLTGEKMRNVAMQVMLEFSPTTQPLELKFLEIGLQMSKGHSH